MRRDAAKLRYREGDGDFDAFQTASPQLESQSLLFQRVEPYIRRTLLACGTQQAQIDVLVKLWWAAHYDWLRRERIDALERGERRRVPEITSETQQAERAAQRDRLHEWKARRATWIKATRQYLELLRLPEQTCGFVTFADLEVPEVDDASLGQWLKRRADWLATTWQFVSQLSPEQWRLAAWLEALSVGAVRPRGSGFVASLPRPASELRALEEHDPGINLILSMLEDGSFSPRLPALEARKGLNSPEAKTLDLPSLREARWQTAEVLSRAGRNRMIAAKVIACIEDAWRVKRDTESTLDVTQFPGGPVSSIRTWLQEEKRRRARAKPLRTKDSAGAPQDV